jgi:hypothetical protein
MGQPCSSNRFGDSELFERFFEYLPPSRKMAAHNRMFGVRPIERLACVLHVRAEKLRGVLILHLFDPSTVGIAEKKADHPIVEHSVDECVDNRPQPRFATEFFEQTVVHEK